jgi:hypothetical protein
VEKNPDAAEHDNFGRSLAVIGPDKLLVSSLNQARAQNIGAAYLFSTNGTLLQTIRCPSTNDGAAFGAALAVITTDRVLIGAPGNGAEPGSVTYVYDLRPTLSISKTDTNAALISWPSPWTAWGLQQNTNGIGTLNWSNIVGGIQDNGSLKYLVVNPPSGNRFYRLYKP